MKIVEPTKTTKYFGNIDPGTVFHLLPNSLYYMKIAPIANEGKDVLYNAINLNYSEARHIDNEACVELVDCELVVK